MCTDCSLTFSCIQPPVIHTCTGTAAGSNVTLMLVTRFDHLVAIERSGRAADGNYYNMRAVNIKHLVDPVDDLFIAAKHIPGIGTTGGNPPTI